MLALMGGRVQQSLRVGFGVGLAALLTWNTWSIGQLRARIGALESAASDLGSASEARRPPSATGLSSGSPPPRPTATPGVEATGRRAEGGPHALSPAGEGDNSAPSTDAQALDAPAQPSLLGLGDPAARTELDAYLDEYLDQRELERDEEGTTEWLGHMDMVLDSFGDEFGLEAETTAAIKDKLMETTGEWVANDEAIGEGEITKREGHERAVAMEEEVMFFLQDKLGEEQAEVLAGRLW